MKRVLLALCVVTFGCSAEKFGWREQGQQLNPKTDDIVIKQTGNGIKTIKCYKPPLTAEETAICANAPKVNGLMPDEISVQKVRLCRETGGTPPEECKDAYYFIHTSGKIPNKVVRGNLAPIDDPTNSKRAMYPEIPNPKQPTPWDKNRPGSGNILLPKDSPGNKAARGTLGFAEFVGYGMEEGEFFASCNLSGPPPPEDFVQDGEVVEVLLVSDDGTLFCNTIASVEDWYWVESTPTDTSTSTSTD
jgi:hypothetical protein